MKKKKKRERSRHNRCQQNNKHHPPSIGHWPSESMGHCRGILRHSTWHFHRVRRGRRGRSSHPLQSRGGDGWRDVYTWGSYVKPRINPWSQLAIPTSRPRCQRQISWVIESSIAFAWSYVILHVQFALLFCSLTSSGDDREKREKTNKQNRTHPIIIIIIHHHHHHRATLTLTLHQLAVGENKRERVWQ